tara:strand:+ start:366 stop:611 length:246 start_codon:yes stop_codon:yes gene_type:complete
MHITVLCFAELAEAIQTSRFELELPDDADVEAAMNILCTRYSPIRSRRDALAIAVNECFADSSHPLHHGDTMALVGPVSGG